jgi:hypothetical protein
VARDAGPGDAVSWAELRPRRRCDWVEEEGRVVLLQPRYGQGRLGRWLERRLGKQPIRVRLDEVGTFVWRRCDGSRPVAGIAEELRVEFGEAIEPAAERLVSFLGSLRRNRFVDLSPDETA